MTNKQALKIIGKFKPNEKIDSIKKLQALMCAMEALEMADKDTNVPNKTDGET